MRVQNIVIYQYEIFSKKIERYLILQEDSRYQVTYCASRYSLKLLQYNFKIFAPR